MTPALWLVAAWAVTVAADTTAPRVPQRNGSLPAVSPDGRRIAFVSDRDEERWELYVVNRDGSGLRRLTHTAESEGVPGWTGDGRAVTALMVRGDTMSLVAVPLEGGDPRPLVTMRAKALSMSWSGRRVAYAAGTWMRSRLWVADLDGSNAVALTDSSGGSFNVAWSPDDRTLAYTHIDSSGAMQVWLGSADGSGGRPLTRFTKDEGRPQWPAWSADGRRVAVQVGLYDRQDPKKSTCHIWSFDVMTGVATKLAPHDKPYLDETPSWFPDGKRLAFQSDRTGRFEVWTMKSNGGDARQVTR